MGTNNQRTQQEAPPPSFCAALDLREIAIRIALENREAACSRFPSLGAARVYALHTRQGILAERAQALRAQANTCAGWVCRLLQ